MLLTTPPHFKYVATLPCETLMSAKQAMVYGVFVILDVCVFMCDCCI